MAVTLSFQTCDIGERIMTTKKTTPKRAPSVQPKKPSKTQQAAKATATAINTVTKSKKLSAIAAAARVLSETGQALTCPELIEAMAAKRYWTSPGGQTPSSTLYAAIAREIKIKGTDARFRKTERGKFAASGVA
jgi:hypothetical protein